MVDLVVSGVLWIVLICIDVIGGEIWVERNLKDCDFNYKILLICD